MASSTISSSSSTKNKVSVLPTGFSSVRAVKHDKRWPSVDDYRYLAAGLLKQHMPKLVKGKLHNTVDGNLMSTNKVQHSELDKIKNAGDIRNMKNLAKEMSRMLMNAKSKGHTNELLQLFKNTLTNFVIDKEHQDSEDELDGNPKEENQLICSKVMSPVTKKYQKAKMVSPKSIDLPSAARPTPTTKVTANMNRQQSKTLGSSEFTMLSDRERSFITTTTTHVTRTKIRDPVISVIESSKTNVLHRCYGKQSVKATPFTYKNSKKPNSILQRPIALKTKTSTKAVKSQHSSVNKQMKTIYENGQFDKSKSIGKPHTPKKKVAIICLPKSDDVDQPPSATKMRNSKEKTTPKNFRDKQFSDEDAKESCLGDSSAQRIIVPSDCTGDVNLLEKASDPDTSLVHRLTSFWNKKLNNAKSVDSDISSIASSTTYIVNTASEMELDAKENQNPLDPKDNVIQLTNEDSKTKILQLNSGKIDGLKDDSKLPDIKMGLMDELITVLKGGNQLAPKKCMAGNDKSNKHICGERGDQKVTVVENKESDELICRKHSNYSMVTNGFETYSGGSHDSTDEESNTEDVTIADDYDFNDTDDTFGNECNEQTIEAVQTCLLRRITVRNFNKRDSDESINKKCAQRVVSCESNRTYQMCDKEMEPGALMKEPSMEIKLRANVQNGNDQTCNENGLMICVSESQISRGESSKDAKQPNSLFNSLTSSNKQRITTTVMNVNDIIHSLRNLIYEIERIPEELKTVNLDLKILPLSDKIKHILSLVLNENLIPKAWAQNAVLDRSTYDDHNISFAVLNNSIADKTIGYSTRGGSLIVCYFASTFNMPIFENVLKPIELILFPKRADYIKSKTKHGQSFGALSHTTKELLSNVEDHRDMKNWNNELCRSGSHENSKDRYACMNRKAAKNHLPHFTLFYGTMAPNKMISTRACPSIVFQPYKKKTVTLKEDLVEKSDMTRDNSVIDLVQTGSTDSYNMNNGCPRNHDCKKTCESSCKVKKEANTALENSNINTANSGVSLQENAINFSEANLVNEINFNRHHSCSNNGKRRRLWRQPNIEDDTCVPTGGAGDYGGVSSPLPCHRTSSMSVMVNSSINDSNSQSDIHMMESECRLRCLIGYPSTVSSRPQSETDNLSSNVIQEACEERMSDIDDCVMLEQHHKRVQGHVRRGSSHKIESEHESKSSCSKISVASHSKRTSTNSNDQDGFQLHQATSTTDLGHLKATLLQDVGTMMSGSDINVSRHNDGPLDKDEHVNKGDYGSTSKNTINKDYIVLHCSSPKPERIRRGLDCQCTTINSKFNLDMIFDNDPSLKQELSNIIDLHDLCNKEKQLIAVCLMLLKRNSLSLYEKYPFNVWLQFVGEKANQLWNTSSQQLGSRMMDARKRLIIKCQSQTQVLITCEYKHMIKIIYTALVSLMLCFIIQKHFCGITLPICFPW